MDSKLAITFDNPWCPVSFHAIQQRIMKPSLLRMKERNSSSSARCALSKVEVNRNAMSASIGYAARVSDNNLLELDITQPKWRAMSWVHHCFRGEFTKQLRKAFFERAFVTARKMRRCALIAEQRVTCEQIITDGYADPTR